LRILHRHYLKELTANVVLTFGVLYFVALMVAVSKLTYHSAGLDPWLVCKTIILWSVDPLPHLIPVAVMIAVVLTYGRAGADREILAVRMGGIHVYQVILPALLLGILFACLNAWLLADVIPSVYYRKHRMAADVASQFFSKTNPVNNLIDLSGFRMRWRRKEEGRFKDVWVDYKEMGICGFAEEVWIEPPLEGKILICFKGFRGFQRGKQMDEEGSFELNAEGLDVEIDVDALFFRQRLIRVKDMTSTQLVAEIMDDRIWAPEVAWHTVFFRMSHSLSTLVLALVGASIGILFQRGGRMAAFGLSFFPIAGYYGLFYLARALIEVGFPPVITGWLPSTVLFLLGLYLLRRITTI